MNVFNVDCEILSLLSLLSVFSLRSLDLPIGQLNIM